MGGGLCGRPFAAFFARVAQWAKRGKKALEGFLYGAVHKGQGSWMKSKNSSLSECERCASIWGGAQV